MERFVLGNSLINNYYKVQDLDKKRGISVIALAQLCDRKRQRLRSIPSGKQSQGALGIASGGWKIATTRLIVFPTPSIGTFLPLPKKHSLYFVIATGTEWKEAISRVG